MSVGYYNYGAEGRVCALVRNVPKVLASSSLGDNLTRVIQTSLAPIAAFS